MAFLSWMKERSAPLQDGAQKPERSWQKQATQKQYRPVAQMSVSELVKAREIGERIKRAKQHVNAGGHSRQSLANEPGASGPQRRNGQVTIGKQGLFAPTNGNTGKATLKVVNTPPEKAIAKVPDKPSTAHTQQCSLQRGRVWIEALGGMMEMRRGTGVKLVGEAGDGGCLRHIDAAISTARQIIELGKPAPGARDEGQSIRGGHALEIRQEDAPGFSRWPDCHKTVTFKDAVCVVQGWGRKAKHFASPNPALRRGQRWPELCSGETYADLFFPILGCVVSSSLLPLFSVGTPQSSD